MWGDEKERQTFTEELHGYGEDWKLRQVEKGVRKAEHEYMRLELARLNEALKRDRARGRRNSKWVITAMYTAYLDLVIVENELKAYRNTVQFCACNFHKNIFERKLCHLSNGLVCTLA